MGEACARFEIFRNAADHEAGVFASVFVDPRQHRCRRRLAMRAAHHKAAFALYDFTFEHLRHGDVGQLLLQQCFEFRVAAGDGVADDIRICI